MKIAAITKFKHGSLWECMQKAGWTQGELASRIGICQTHAGRICNLTSRPTEETANKIQLAFGQVGIFFDPLEAWPDAFKPLRKAPIVQQIKESDPELGDCNIYKELEESTGDGLQARLDELEIQFAKLEKEKPRDAKILKEWADGKTAKQIAKNYGITTARIYSLISSASRKIRLGIQTSLQLNGELDGVCVRRTAIPQLQNPLVDICPADLHCREV